jgi:indole-3-pyruvate monooxygenase
LAEILEDGAIFADGEERRFDAIIFATGYRPGYQNFLHPDDSLGASSQGVGPPIYFVGFRNPVTGLLQEISKEAQSVANAIARGPT